MLKIIIAQIVLLFLKIRDTLFRLQRYSLMYDLRAHQNVHIDESFTLGKFSDIIIQGTCKQLQINSNVSTRMYCSFMIFPNASLTIGKGVFFNNSCSINCLGQIEIGDNVLFGEGVKIYDHNHLFEMNNSELKVHRNNFKIGKISIGSNTWIGSNVTILNNVSIGENVIIGANCLIHKSVPSNSIVKHIEDLSITSLPSVK